MHSRPLELARRAAKFSLHPKFRMGAVVMKRKEMISFGANKHTKTHPRSRSPWRTIHAELDAILGVEGEILRGATMYVVRVGARGELRTSKPCEGCEALLRSVGIDRVVFVMGDHIESMWL